MHKFGHGKAGGGSQILGEAQASFLHRPESRSVDKERSKGNKGSTATRGSAAATVPSAVTTIPIREGGGGLTRSDSQTGEWEVKAWEEPPLPKPQSDRRTSYVRLPGPLLTNEEDEDLALEKELRAKEIINYLQDKWNLSIDKKSSLVEIQYRTADMLLHKLPPNHWLLKRARQKIAEHTGFFSDVTKPYEFLGVPEMDNDMVIFRNLPEFLKISADEWIEVQLRREREKEREKARLPRLSNLKSKRTIYTHGRIKRGAGGISYAERLIANGELFRRGWNKIYKTLSQMRGPMTFARLLEKWAESKEDETANRGSPFGQVKRTKMKKEVAAMPDLTGAGGAGFERDDLGRLVTQVDDKIYQEFLNMEKMIIAIYNLIKSMINVKMSQLKSQNRIPFSGVMELRSRSPTRAAAKKGPPMQLLSKLNKNTGFYTALSRGLTGTPKESSEPKQEFVSESDLGNTESKEFEMRVKNMGPKYSILQFHGSGRNVPRPFNPVTVGEVYPVSETGSAEDVKVSVDRVQKITESACYLDDRPYELRSRTLRKERPMAQAERNRRHSERFRAMFLHRLKPPESIWWNVYVRDYKKLEAEIAEDEVEVEVESNPIKSVESVKSTTAETLTRSEKNPDPGDIPTPKLPGLPSIEYLSSEEQSRLNLLMIVPEAAYAEPPRSAVRKLYELAGVKTLDKDLFNIMMGIKRPFRTLEKTLRGSVTSKVEKFEWDTPKRYKAKINADCSSPIYERGIANMRYLSKLAAKKELDDIENNFDDTDISEKQPAPWFRDLVEMCDQIGALKHHGCSTIVHKLVRFCDVHSNSKPFMLKRFCLLVISLPANELAAPHWQKAIAFLLDRLFVAPPELLPEWLLYRGFKPLVP